jgi:hypothetical protein
MYHTLLFIFIRQKMGEIERVMPPTLPPPSPPPPALTLFRPHRREVLGGERGVGHRMPCATLPAICGGCPCKSGGIASTYRHPGRLGPCFAGADRGTVMLNLNMTRNLRSIIARRTNPVDLKVIATFTPLFRKHLEIPSRRSMV